MKSRTPAEIAYDATRLSPIAWAAELRAAVDAAPDQATKSRLILRAADQILHPAETLQITRHTHHDDGEPARDPWTTYALGEASIDIQDAGTIHLHIGQGYIDLDDPVQLLDLAQLLTDERLLEAIDPSH